MFQFLRWPKKCRQMGKPIFSFADCSVGCEQGFFSSNAKPRAAKTLKISIKLSFHFFQSYHIHSYPPFESIWFFHLNFHCFPNKNRLPRPVRGPFCWWNNGGTGTLGLWKTHGFGASLGLKHIETIIWENRRSSWSKGFVEKIDGFDSLIWIIVSKPWRSNKLWNISFETSFSLFKRP